MLEKLIADNYNMEIRNMTLIDHHFGTKIYLLVTDKGKYIVKTLPLHAEGMENEGYITEYLHKSGISVARLLKTICGTYHVRTDDMQFHVQEYIEGETLQVNTAPEWFMEKCVCTLGKIHHILKGYGELNTNFNGDFFSKPFANAAKDHYLEQLREARERKDTASIPALQERVKHLERIAEFDIDAKKLTYSNSHGDFWIAQIIVRGEELTVIDWTSACRLPVCLEIIMSYATADPACKEGAIDAGRLNRYISHYLQHFTLTGYDIKMMPYVYYHQQILCHYPPPYDNVPDAYKPICAQINNSANWLYDNAETLSKELCTL